MDNEIIHHPNPAGERYIRGSGYRIGHEASDCIRVATYTIDSIISFADAIGVGRLLLNVMVDLAIDVMGFAETGLYANRPVSMRVDEGLRSFVLASVWNNRNPAIGKGPRGLLQVLS